MNKKINIMTDIETLGVQANSTIFQISASAFDIETGEIIDSFNKFADVSKSTLNADGSTLKWWTKTNPELFAQLLNEGELSPEELVFEFHGWLTQFTEDKDNDVYLWGNGILFDNNTIRTQFENVGLKYPIFYRNDRDVRTIVDLCANKLGISENELKAKFDDESLTTHNAMDDVVFQVNLVSYCYNKLVSKLLF